VALGQVSLANNYSTSDTIGQLVADVPSGLGKHCGQSLTTHGFGPEELGQRFEPSEGETELCDSELLGLWTLSIVRNSKYKKIQRFGNWICFRPQVRWQTPATFYPRKYYVSASGSHFCWRLSKPQGIVRMEGLDKLKNSHSPHRGLDPATLRLVAQCLDHYANLSPTEIS
jgi:hypothetical protein